MSRNSGPGQELPFDFGVGACFQNGQIWIGSLPSNSWSASCFACSVVLVPCYSFDNCVIPDVSRHCHIFKQRLADFPSLSILPLLNFIAQVTLIVVTVPCAHIVPQSITHRSFPCANPAVLYQAPSPSSFTLCSTCCLFSSLQLQQRFHSMQLD